MFECTYKSREREEALLRRFLNCIDDMKEYLDEYDERFGLAFAPYDYEDCLCHVENFLSDRLSDVCDEMERLRG